MTSVDDELFVLLYRYDNQVAVYSIDNYQPLRQLHLPDLKRNGEDMTSCDCERHKCVYVSDTVSRCIHRFDLGTRTVTKWSIPGSPRGLSATPDCNLLVTCRDQNNKHILIELSAENGQRVREVTLHSGIHRPCHAVQLNTGHFIISHAHLFDLLGFYNQVSVVSVKGKVWSTFGDREIMVHSFVLEGGRFSRPCHLAVDEDSQFIFVADGWRDRIVLLSPALELVRYASIKGVSWPYRVFLGRRNDQHRLHCDTATRRLLYVGQRYGNVVVIRL